MPTRAHLKAVPSISALFLVLELWIGLPFLAFSQSRNESTWYSRFIGTYGAHTKKYSNGELEVNAPKDNNEGLASLIHDWLQDHFTERSVENQERELEPAIQSYIHNGNAGVLLEVRMYGASDFEYPFVFIHGAGRDFKDAFGNQISGPTISRDFPSGMSDPDESYLTWAHEQNGQLVFDDYWKGWNTTTTPAGRDMLAANAAEQMKHLFEQCKIEQSSSPLISKIAPPPVNPSASSSRAASGGQAHAPPRGGIDSDSDRDSGTGQGTSSASSKEGSKQTEGGSFGDAKEGMKQTGDGSWEHPWRLSPTEIEEDNLVQGTTRPIGEPNYIAQAHTPAPQPQAARAKPVVVNGVVVDPNGNVVAESKVWLFGPLDDPAGTDLSKSPVTTTDASGAFHFLDVQPGHWDLEIEADGWASYASGIMNVSSSINLTIALKPKLENFSDMYWGIPGTRAWIDLAGEGVVDFCRLINPQVPVPSQKFLICTYSSGPRLEQLYQGKQLSVTIPDKDWSDDFAWVDVTGDHHLALCRALPNDSQSQKGRLSCLLSGSNFSKSITTPVDKVIDLGIPSARAWVDVNGDGKTDFCTVLETPSGGHRLSCWLSEGDHFNDLPVMSENVEWQPDRRLRVWIDINSDKTTAFCTVAGEKDEFLDCTLWQGNKFGPTVRDLIGHPMTK